MTHQPDNEMLTSFSNPNYGLTHADAANANRGQHYFAHDDDDFRYSETDRLTCESPLTPNRPYDLTGSTERLMRLETGSADSGLPTPDSEGIYSCVSSLPSPQDDLEDEDASKVEVKSGFMCYYASLERSRQGHREENVKKNGRLNREASSESSYEDDKGKDINSPDSNDSGIQADDPTNTSQQPRLTQPPPANDHLYTPPTHTSQQDETDDGKDEDDTISGEVNHSTAAAAEEEEEEVEGEDDMPPGWEKHEDQDGAYYWHIKSGTIQRERPPALPPEQRQLAALTTSISSQMSQSTCSYDSYTSMESTSDRCLQEFEEPTFEPPPQEDDTETLVDETEEDRVASVRPVSSGGVRFAVRSLGWVRIAEDDLTPERSSKAVNKCIVDLSLGRNDINDVVGRWGEGKDLFMDLDHQNLTLMDPQDMSVLNIQAIHSIRVWGVGRDNGRDFAYVARDRTSRKHMCHVFRCDTPARQIANTLRDICKHIMLERGLSSSSSARMTRPNHLPNLDRVSDTHNGHKITFETLLKSTSFPTPMEEPKKVLRCYYLGRTNVSKPTGVEVLNAAMEKVHSQVAPDKWVYASVAVAPSTITITEHGRPDNVLAECRVRFLSFMGIAMKNVRLCAYIMHTAQDNYVTHVFHCDPSAGALCKTIEAACKLRYQKCLDAHQKQPATRQRGESTSSNSQGLGASIKHSVQTVFSNMRRSRKS